jgi:hypothetical protein
VTRTYRYLFALSALLLVCAIILKRIRLSDRGAIVVGLIELAAAAALGIAFGVGRSDRNEEE